jgi:polar amino acid transport system substrate-binding protein
MKKSIAFAVCQALLCLCVVSAQELIQIDQADPPFMYAQDGRPAGLYPRIITEAFSRMATGVEISAVPWKRALSDTDAGKAGTAGIYKNSERLKNYDFSSPFFEERIAVYSLGGKLKFTKLQDLFGKTVGVIDGWSYGDEFDAAVLAGKIRVETVNGDTNNMRKLAYSHVDAVLAIVESGELALKKMKLESTIQRAPVFFAIYNVHLAFNKSAGKTKLLARFDEAIESMKADGTLSILAAKSFRSQ